MLISIVAVGLSASLCISAACFFLLIGPAGDRLSHWCHVCQCIDVSRPVAPGRPSGPIGDPAGPAIQTWVHSVRRQGMFAELTSGHRRSPSVARGHLRSPAFTYSHLLSPPITRGHTRSPAVTCCHLRALPCVNRHCRSPHDCHGIRQPCTSFVAATTGSVVAMPVLCLVAVCA